MKIVVPVKYAPDPTLAWAYGPDQTLDRDDVTCRLSELDEYAVEQAISLVEAGLEATITYVTMGPQGRSTRCARLWPWAEMTPCTWSTTLCAAQTPSPRRWCSPRSSNDSASTSCCAAWRPQTGRWASSPPCSRSG